MKYIHVPILATWVHYMCRSTGCRVSNFTACVEIPAIITNTAKRVQLYALSSLLYNGQDNHCDSLQTFDADCLTFMKNTPTALLHYIFRALWRRACTICNQYNTNHTLTVWTILYYTYVHNFKQNLQNSALLLPQHMYVYCDLIHCTMF